MTEITAGEIARRIQETDEKLSTVVIRVRSWTKERVLAPIGKRKPGTGRPLNYPERAIVDAAILSRLARHYGMWAPKVLQLFVRSGALDRAVEQLAKVKGFTEKGQDVYLIVGRTIEDRANLSEPWQILSDVCLVDLPLLSRPAKAGPHKKTKALEMPALMRDGLFINLSVLFEQLGLPLKDVADQEAFFKNFPDARRIKLG